jgi:hypothetical protein
MFGRAAASASIGVAHSSGNPFVGQAGVCWCKQEDDDFCLL